MRAVNPVSGSAAGPTSRRASVNDSRVDHSTIMRAGRSVRLQTIARSPVTSPTIAPCAVAGRAPSSVTSAAAARGTEQRACRRTRELGDKRPPGAHWAQAYLRTPVLTAEARPTCLGASAASGTPRRGARCAPPGPGARRPGCCRPRGSPLLGPGRALPRRRASRPRRARVAGEGLDPRVDPLPVVQRHGGELACRAREDLDCVARGQLLEAQLLAYPRIRHGLQALAFHLGESLLRSPSRRSRPLSSESASGPRGGQWPRGLARGGAARSAHHGRNAVQGIRERVPGLAGSELGHPLSNRTIRTIRLYPVSSPRVSSVRYKVDLLWEVALATCDPSPCS